MPVIDMLAGVLSRDLKEQDLHVLTEQPKRGLVVVRAFREAGEASALGMGEDLLTATAEAWLAAQSLPTPNALTA